MSKLISSSLGSKYTIFQSHDKIVSSLCKIQLTDIEIVTLFGSSNFTKCCSRGSCILSLFVNTEGSTDMNAAIEYFRRCRELTRTKDKEEKSLFLLEQYRNCLVNQSGNRFASIWTLLDKKDVCRKSWGLAYDFTKYELDICSEKLKEDMGIVKLSTTAFTERTLHSFNYTETIEMMNDNLLDPGNLILP
jgi:hypothetical protein